MLEICDLIDLWGLEFMILKIRERLLFFLQCVNNPDIHIPGFHL
jgi:hypothetical protein